MTWWTVVGFGGPSTAYGAGGAYKTPEEARARIVRHNDIAAMHPGRRLSTANTRMYGYRTREQARHGDISHGIGQGGRIE
jgi:hypothetical protein